MKTNVRKLRESKSIFNKDNRCIFMDDISDFYSEDLYYKSNFRTRGIGLRIDDNHIVKCYGISAIIRSLKNYTMNRSIYYSCNFKLSQISGTNIDSIKFLSDF